MMRSEKQGPSLVHSPCTALSWCTWQYSTCEAVQHPLCDARCYAMHAVMPCTQGRGSGSHHKKADAPLARSSAPSAVTHGQGSGSLHGQQGPVRASGTQSGLGMGPQAPGSGANGSNGAQRTTPNLGHAPSGVPPSPSLHAQHSSTLQHAGSNRFDRARNGSFGRGGPNGGAYSNPLSGTYIAGAGGIVSGRHAGEENLKVGLCVHWKILREEILRQHTYTHTHSVLIL